MCARSASWWSTPPQGMKRYGVMSRPLRNKIGRFEDRAALVSAGLWNHHLASSHDPA